MGRGPITGRGHIDYARIRLCIGNELWKGLGWNRWIYHHDKGATDNARDRRDVAYKIVIEACVKRRVDCIRRHDFHEKRVAVWRGFHDGLGANTAAGARSVLNY